MAMTAQIPEILASLKSDAAVFRCYSTHGESTCCCFDLGLWAPDPSFQICRSLNLTDCATPVTRVLLRVFVLAA